MAYRTIPTKRIVFGFFALIVVVVCLLFIAAGCAELQRAGVYTPTPPSDSGVSVNSPFGGGVLTPPTGRIEVPGSDASGDDWVDFFINTAVAFGLGIILPQPRMAREGLKATTEMIGRTTNAVGRSLGGGNP